MAELIADDFKFVMPPSAHRLFLDSGQRALVVCLTSLFFLATFQVAASAQDDVNRPAAVIDDTSQSDPLISELESGTNSELIAAMESLDESLNNDGQPAGDQLIRNRLVAIGLVGGTFLALLGVVFGYLRMDHATRGFYSGRLQLVAGGCSIVILAVSYFLWTQVLFQ